MMMALLGSVMPSRVFRAFFAACCMTLSLLRQLSASLTRWALGWVPVLQLSQCFQSSSML
ncbi:hypothetical protein BIFGAL_03156 [Bifidobacterium gallicum DSM 20093 = LMG 11596]|nr:hypothetical protein BIFGAL_03156 [Bifidobacterium gallicum DSM 20093 = LMG 11596]